MNPNALPSESAGVAAVINPASYTTVQLSGAVDMSLFESAQAILQTGVITATGVVNAKLTSSATSGGTYTDVTGKAITALAATTDDNKQVIINVRGSELTPGHRFVKFSVTPSVAAAILSAVVMGHYPRLGSASDNDISAVKEIIA